MAVTSKRHKPIMSTLQSGAGPVTPDIQIFRQELHKRAGGSNLYVTLLGIRRPFSTPQLLRQIEKGFSFAAVEHLQRNIALSLQELAELVQIKPRTLHRRKVEGRLQPDESDR